MSESVTHLFLSDETRLRAACYDALADDAAWNAYADWLRDQGNERMAERLPTLRALLVARLPVAERLD